MPRELFRTEVDEKVVRDVCAPFPRYEAGSLRLLTPPPRITEVGLTRSPIVVARLEISHERGFIYFSTRCSAYMGGQGADGAGRQVSLAQREKEETDVE